MRCSWKGAERDGRIARGAGVAIDMIVMDMEMGIVTGINTGRIPVHTFLGVTIPMWVHVHA